MPWFAWIVIAGIVSGTAIEIAKIITRKAFAKDVDDLKTRVEALEKASKNESSSKELTK